MKRSLNPANSPESSQKRCLPRRNFLRGLGTAIALPAVESLFHHQPAQAAISGSAKRLVFIFMPNGANMKEWTPTTEGGDYQLSPILKSLQPFQQDLLVLSGLSNMAANVSVAGGHARGLSTFLTGVLAHKTAGRDIRAGVSVDQLAAQYVGDQTRLRSLELGCEIGRSSGNCDSGYSCAYSNNLSWRNPTTPVPADINPRSVFDRLFFDRGTVGDEARAQRDFFQKSVLDFAREDARQLKTKLGITDRQKIDEYLTSIRDLERRVERASQPDAADQDEFPLARPQGIPHDFGEHVRLMCDLLVVALQADITRTCSLMLGRAGSNRSYSFIGIPEGHHWLSHHGGDQNKHEKISRINQYLVEHFAYLLGKMKSVREGDATLLDNSLVVYGSGISDGNSHNYDSLPILLAGRGGGTIQPGRHLHYPDNEPLMNLFLAMLQAVDIPVDSLGDSTRPLSEITT